MSTPQRISAPDRHAALYMMAGGIIISFSSVFVKLARVTPTISGFYRVLIGGCCLLFWVLVSRKRLFNGVRGFLLTVLCGFFFALDLYTWHRSIHLVGPGLATILGNLQVFILAAAGAVFYGEKLTLRLVLSAGLAIFGLLLVVGIRWDTLGPEYQVGIIWGLATAGCYAAFTLCLRMLQSADQPLSPAANLMLVSLVSAGFLALDAWQGGESFRIPDRESLLALIGLGVLSQVVGWLIITGALPKIRAAAAGLLLLLQPALAFVWDVLFFQRPTTLRGFIGIALTLTAIYLGSTRRPAATKH